MAGGEGRSGVPACVDATSRSRHSCLALMLTHPLGRIQRAVAVPAGVLAARVATAAEIEAHASTRHVEITSFCCALHGAASAGRNPDHRQAGRHHSGPKAAASRPQPPPCHRL